MSCNCYRPDCNCKKCKEELDKTISVNTLNMIDSSIDNFKNGVVGEPVDIDEIKIMLKKLDDKEKVELALYLSKIVHNNCEHCGDDIGMILIKGLENYCSGKI